MDIILQKEEKKIKKEIKTLKKEEKKVEKEQLLIEKENKKTQKEEIRNIFSRLRKKDKNELNNEVSGYKSFDSFVKAHEWAHPKYKKWIGNLTGDEFKAIFHYCKKGHININDYLKGKAGTCSKDDAIKIDVISRALKRSKVPAKVLVYKGCSEDDFKDLLNKPKEEIIGMVLTDNAFMSTSMVEKIAKRHEKGVMLEIQVDKGAKGGYVGTISEHVEAEILFDKGQQLEIIDVVELDKAKKIQCKFKNNA